ncbi:MAG: alginate O-acetyltransferase AlgX-related protein [Planctomycetaceae bacterium]
MTRHVARFGWSVGLLTTIWTGGSACVLIFGEPNPPGESESTTRTVMLTVAVVFAVITILSGIYIWRIERRKCGFIAILTAMTAVLAVVSAEMLARRYVPAWPASALHGVTSDRVMVAWGGAADDPRDPGVNSWGQRDRERTIRPAESAIRVAFVGDSFLEEGTTPPVSLLVEQQLGEPNIEVLNLGVSATGPDEYYDRLRSVAFPLKCSHCVVFVFAGNDFASPARTLESFGGMAAVSPRRSWLSTMGLRSINHLLTNNRRPVFQAWLAAGGLLQQEKSLHDFLLSADDATARQALLFADETTPDRRQRLAERLNGEDISDFLEMLRHPDADRFRSYYLSSALWAAAEGNGQWERESEELVWFWTQEMVSACRSNDVEFLLVIVPDAFQVDPRMRRLWSPLTDMKHLTEPSRITALKLRQQVEKVGIDVVDLHDVLDQQEGTYLNLDGHWTAKGGELVAAALAQKLRQRLAKPRTLE